MSRSFNRRKFLSSVAAGVAVAPGIQVARLFAAPASSKVNIGCIGVGGKGASDIAEVSAGHNIAALCDVETYDRGRARREQQSHTRKPEQPRDPQCTGLRAASRPAPRHDGGPRRSRMLNACVGSDGCMPCRQYRLAARRVLLPDSDRAGHATTIRLLIVIFAVESKFA